MLTSTEQANLNLKMWGMLDNACYLRGQRSDAYLPLPVHMPFLGQACYTSIDFDGFSAFWQSGTLVHLRLTTMQGNTPCQSSWPLHRYIVRAANLVRSLPDFYAFGMCALAFYFLEQKP